MNYFKPILYSISVLLLVALVSIRYQHATQKVVVPTVSSATSSNDAPSDMSPNCAAYYNNAGNGTDPIDTELADFTNLHPLSDYLCGSYSDVLKTTLADGKVLYFVDPIAQESCGSGGCTYFPMIEERPGAIRRIRGFTGGSDAGDDSVFGFLSFPKKGVVEVYWHESATCGTTNTYGFTATDTPYLISTSDSCSQEGGVQPQRK